MRKHLDVVERLEDPSRDSRVPDVQLYRPFVVASAAVR